MIQKERKQTNRERKDIKWTPFCNSSPLAPLLSILGHEQLKTLQLLDMCIQFVFGAIQVVSFRFGNLLKEQEAIIINQQATFIQNS